MRLTIEVVSDVICPWCFVGKRRLEKAMLKIADGEDVNVVWKPFELNPDMPKEGMERSEYRVRKFGSPERSAALDARMRSVGQTEGIVFSFDRMTRTPNTFDAHRLIWLAERTGVQDAVVERLFRAYFEEGEDIGRTDTLQRIATEAGLDAEQIFTSDLGSAEVRIDLGRARQLGISGVPAFVINGVPIISGAQPPELMAAAITEALREPVGRCSVDDGPCG